VQEKISSHVHATYPLAEGPAALKAIAARKVMGKVILRP
jgi:NADPH2:quinone reductase